MRSALIGVLVGLGACGGGLSGAPPGDGGLSGVPPGDGGDAPKGEVAPVLAGCTPGLDQTCNDSPSASALLGTCMRFGDYGICTCSEGASINPKTQLCRAGSMCVAAAADPWPTTIALEHADCASRPLEACAGALPEGGSGAQLLNAEILELAKRVCNLPPYHWVRVEITSGCPTSLQVRKLDADAADESLVQCLVEALSTKHWACGRQMECSMVEWDTLLPLAP